MKLLKHKMLCSLLSFSLLLSACGQSAPADSESATGAESSPAASAAKEETAKTEPAETVREDKTETVYVTADAYGTPTKITSEVVLRSPGDGQPIQDVSCLENIRNTEGDENFTQNGEDLTWENKGENIHYKGTTLRALPVDTVVSYTLDGNAVTAEELAGKSGHVTIRFDYTNHQTQTVSVKGGSYTVNVPFAALTVVPLSEDHFYNVEVKNGEVSEMDGSTLVMGIALPGLADSLKLTQCEMTEDIDIPEYMEIDADVVDFHLDFSATVITSGLLEDTDLSDLDDLDTLPGDIDELRDGLDDLTDGTQELYDASDELRDALDEFADGMGELESGTDDLAKAAGQFSDGLTALQKNSDDLKDGTSQLVDMVLQYVSAQWGVELSWKNYEKKLSKAEVSEEMIEAALQTGLLSEEIAEEDRADTLRQAAIAQLKGAKAVADGCSSYTDGVKQLAENGVLLKQGTEALEEGSDQLDAAAIKLSDAGQEFEDAIGELRDGVADMKTDVLDELDDLNAPGLKDIADRLRAVQQAEDAYSSYSGLREGCTGSVSFIVETAEIGED